MSKGINIRVIIGSILAVLCIAPASANLIVNGGFEEATGDPLGGGNGWNYYSSEDVPGWDGSNLELWGTHGIGSFEGDFHAELNAAGQKKNEGRWTISQTFDTTIGQTYELSFAYGARLGNAKRSKEAFKVQVSGEKWKLGDHVVGQWHEFYATFVADSDTAKLKFTSVAQKKWTYGNFLDNIVVTTMIPEPGSLALLVMGLLGLGAGRKMAK